MTRCQEERGVWRLSGLAVSVTTKATVVHYSFLDFGHNTEDGGRAIICEVTVFSLLVNWADCGVSPIAWDLGSGK